MQKKKPTSTKQKTSGRKLTDLPPKRVKGDAVKGGASSGGVALNTSGRLISTISPVALNTSVKASSSSMGALDITGTLIDK